jgi:hypothetical protein
MVVHKKSHSWSLLQTRVLIATFSASAWCLETPVDRSATSMANDTALESWIDCGARDQVLSAAGWASALPLRVAGCLPPGRERARYRRHYTVLNTIAAGLQGDGRNSGHCTESESGVPHQA